MKEVALEIGVNMPKSLYKLSYIALYTALAYILYLIRIPLPFFPGFLKLNLADVPLILATFQLGAVPGMVIALVRCLLKLPLTNTLYVGELADFVIGIVLVISIASIYRVKRNLGGAILAIFVGIIFSSLIASLLNYYLLIPMYVRVFYKGDAKKLVAMLPKNLNKNVKASDIKKLIVLGGVLPFNLFRSLLNGVLGYVIFKFTSSLNLFEVEHKKGHENLSKYNVYNLKGLQRVANSFANSLNGGEIVILNGELGAGKTTFVKYVCEALGVNDYVTSPTFTIQNVYEGKFKINHIDMYRLEAEDELQEVGIREEIGLKDTITFIEWNKFDNLIGDMHWVNIEKVFFNKFRKIEILK